MGFRGRRFLPGRTRSKLLIESWSMVVFITGVLWFTGKGASPLFNLYLLPIILSALTLGRVITLLQVAAIAVCHLLLAMTTPGLDVISLLYASQVVGQLAPFLLVAYLTTTLSADITEARERIENLAQTDSLTGLYNVRMFNEVWQREHDACERNRGVYSLLMIDIDKLKEINDVFGLEAGNSAITLVAQCLQRSIRATDHAARLGGDEFAVLLPGASPEVAEAVIKRVRHNVYKTTLGSQVAHDPLQRQHRRGQLPQGREGHARPSKPRGRQDVPRQRAAPHARSRSKRLNTDRQTVECAGLLQGRWQS